MRPHISRAPAAVVPRWRLGAGGRRSDFLVVVVTVTLALLVLAPVASADLSFGFLGSGAGQTDNSPGYPRGIAVDTSNGRLYVADVQNNRVDVFESSGTFLFAFGWKVNGTSPEEQLQTCTALTGCQKGMAGPGAGQLSRPEKVAVDSSSHVVYISESEDNHRVQKFDSEGHFIWMAGGEVDKTTHADLCTAASHDVCGVGIEGGTEGRFSETISVGLPVAVGPGEVLYVADSQKITGSEGFNTRIQKFESSGAYVGQVIVPGNSVVGRVQALVVDSSGDFYFATDGLNGNGVRKFDPTGNLASGWGEEGKVDSGFGSIFALAFDPAGDLFVSDHYETNTIREYTIREYDASGIQVRALYGALKSPATGLAVHLSGGGGVFAGDLEGLSQIAFPPPGPVTLLGCSATGVGNSRATLNCLVNPEGKATEYRFQYVDDATFQHDVDVSGAGHGFDHAQETSLEAVPLPGGLSFSPQSVVKQLPLESLAPETTYHFRLLASNADAPSGDPGPEGSVFTTLGPPEVLSSWVTDVGTDAAYVHAEVNPLLLATTGYFQYVDDATYRADVEALGAGHGFDHALNAPDVPGGAKRIDFGHGEGAVANASELYPLEPGTVYHYRLVAEDPFAPVFGPERVLRTFSLPGVGGGGCPNRAFRVGPSAGLPDCRAFEMVSPLDKNNGDIRSLGNFTGYPTVLDQSSVDGAGFAYTSYRAFGDPRSAPYTNQYLARRDPERGWLSQTIDPPRGPQFYTELEDEYKAFSPDLSTAWLLQEGEPPLDSCAPAGYADLYHRDNSSGLYHALSCAQPSLQANVFIPELEGFSADDSLAVFRVNDALTPDASSTGNYQVYESSGTGQLRLVSILPDGEASSDDSGVGTSSNALSHNRFQSIIHAVSADGSKVFWSAHGRIYLRENADLEQSMDGSCDEPERACTIPLSRSVTNEPAFFQAADTNDTKAIFTVEAGPSKGDLYEFDVATEEAHLIAGKVIKNILGASDDLSRVYFVSEEASVQAQAEGAIENEPNIYFDEQGTIHFVGTLSSTEFSDTFGSAIDTRPINRVARVSPDGLHLVFMSHSRALSERTAGYDNTDVTSGQADAEVYLYDATANNDTGKLRCISCNPTGAQPSGHEIATGLNSAIGPRAAATVPRFETDLYQSHYLSDDGSRVFFNSYEALVPSDTNGKEDVYEWEVSGAGDCTTANSSYVPSEEGCLSLISSGRSNEDSEFVDASPTGSDVFFTTSEGLVPQDTGLVDVYDARVDGGFPAPGVSPAACEGEACQGAAVPPLDSTPASFTFSGPGNITAPIPTVSRAATVKPKIKPCRKGTVRKKGKCVAAKTKKKKTKAKAKKGSAKTGKSSLRAIKPNRRTAR